MSSDLWSFCVKILTLGGKKSYLWQWPLSDDLQGKWNILFLNFDDFGVFNMEIHFSVNAYTNMLIKNYMNMIAINHIIHWNHEFFKK